MARKSERNKASADKSEKAAPTGRKPGRPSRRRKKSTSDSEPDPEVTAEETPEEIPLPSQIQSVEVVETSDTTETKARRGRPRKQPLPLQEVQQPVEEVAAKPATEDKDLSEWKEDGAFWGESSKVAAEPAPVETETSTWKIQSSNGSGGEIQKLKICRQRLTDSAESSSSPTKEIASPRRKRKERHLEADCESVGSHSDAETASATVVSAIPETQTSTNQEVVDSTSTSHLEEISLPEEQAVVTKEADSATEEKAPSPQSEPEPVTESVLEPESVPEPEPEPEPEHAPEPEPEPEHAPEPEHEREPEHEHEPAPAPEPISEEAIVDNDVSKETEVVTESTEAIQQEAAVERSESMEVVVEEAEETQITETAVVEEKVEQMSEKPVVRENQEAEEGELKQPPKPKDYSKLAVSNEDAMQQIAKKLNERAARFSKEATEEMKRTAVARPSKETIEEEDHEEGEISRDTSTVKKLELKRLNDDDNEPSKNSHSRTRRLNALTSPHDLVNQNEKPSQFDVSTETLKDVIGDQIELVTEEEVAKIFAPDDDEPEQRLIVSDEESGGDIGDAAPEEEGEVVDNDKEGLTKSPSDRGKEDHNTKKAGSREPKRSERRVTKESPKKSSKSDRKERRSSVDEHKSKKKSDKENIKKDKDLKIKPDKPMPSKSEENHKPIRKIALVSDDAKNTIRRSISPPMKQPSQVLFITNLVRPFTIGQLRELLARTGTISPNGFYIDKIKSKCFVKYNDVEMAIETRHALHGVRWPVTNPRTLRVEFSSDEAMEAVKKLAEDEENAAKKQDLTAHGQDSEWLSERDVMKPAKKTKNSVREWDMGKDVSEIQETVKKGKEEEWGVKSREKRFEKIDGAGKRRAVSPSQEKTEPARKIKKRDNDAPAKLLDDLFRKTEATPCIYWLPLTASQIAVKEEIRRQHMAEHQKRLAEMKKTESMRREKDKSRDRDRERDRYRDRRRK